MAGAKRPRENDNLGAGRSVAITSESVLSACIQREELQRAIALVCFPKFVRSSVVRVTLTPKHGAVLCSVAGLGRPTAKPYSLGPEVGGTSRLTLRLLLHEGGARPSVDVAIVQISNSQPSPVEVAAFIELALAGAFIWDEAAAAKARLGRARMIRDAQAGRPASLPGGLWGSERKHRSAVLLRSWIAEAGPVSGSYSRLEEQVQRSEQCGSHAITDKTSQNTSADAEYFRVCLAEHPKPGDNLGSGPCRWREKWRGEFSFLLRHSLPSASSQSTDIESDSRNSAAALASSDSLTVQTAGGSGSISQHTLGETRMLEVPAHPVYDEAQPDITAWRGVREVLGNHISLASFRNSIVCHLDCKTMHKKQLDCKTMHGKQEGGVLPSDVAGAGIAPAASFADTRGLGKVSTSALSITATQPPPPLQGSNRKLNGDTQLFIVDADVLFRTSGDDLPVLPGTAVEGVPPNAVPFCPNPGMPGVFSAGKLGAAVRDSAGKQDRDDALASVKPSKHPRKDAIPSFVWVSESYLRKLLPAETPTVLLQRGNIIAQRGTNTCSTDPILAEAQEATGASASGSGSLSGYRASNETEQRASTSSSASRVWMEPPAGDLLRACMAALVPSLSDEVGRFLPCRRGSIVRMYHGTKPSLARKLVTEGFRRPMCRYLPACRGDIPPRGIGGPCRCQMEGFGVYFGKKDKALKFATRRAEYDAVKGCSMGALIVVDVDLGWCKQAETEPCPCGCGMKYVDHLGSWYARDGYDSLYVTDNSMPASATAEWCVADPSRVRIVAVEEVVTAGEDAQPQSSGYSNLASGGGDGGGQREDAELDYDSQERAKLAAGSDLTE